MNWEDSSPWCLPYLWEQKNRPVENFTFWCKIHSSRYLRGLKGMLLIWNHAYSIFVSGCHSQDFNCDCILQLTTTATRFHHINTVLQQSRYLWDVSIASVPLPPATPWCMHGNNDWIVFIWDIRENYHLMIKGQTTLTGLLLPVGELSSIPKLGLSCQPQTGLGLALKVFQPPKTEHNISTA